MSATDDTTLKQILAQGLSTEAQVEEALGIQSAMRAMGLRPRSVEAILVEKGYLDYVDLEQIQKEVHDVGGREQIAGFKLLELLGHGAMGAVYKAQQLSLDRTVALRVLDSELAEDASYVEAFLKEARAVARLSHTNLISGIDVGDDEGVKYLATEFADGISLARLLHRGGAMDEERALGVAHQLARALDYAHKNGLVHGDVRPDKVIITEDGITKLSDLGLARREVVVSDPEGHELKGSPDYLSPEQARGLDELGPAADLYGLGATLFHMLTGTPPFAGDSREAVVARHLTEPAASVRALDPDLSEATAAVVARCLQKGPDARFESAAALAAALEAAQASVQATRAAAAPAGGPPPAGGGAAAAKPAGPAVKRRRRRR